MEDREYRNRNCRGGKSMKEAEKKGRPRRTLLRPYSLGAVVEVFIRKSLKRLSHKSGKFFKKLFKKYFRRGGEKR